VVTPDWAWRARFLWSYLAGDRALMGPFAAVIDVTRRCNLTCVGCPSHAPGVVWQARREDDDFAWDDFVRVCRELRELGTRKMILIGEGEPTLHPRLPDMIAEARRCGFRATLFTNGTRLDERLARAIAVSGLDEIRISLWASDEQEYARNYGGSDPRLFRRAIDGARAVSRARDAAGLKTPRLVLHRPIDREHFRRLEAMVGVARDAGCDALSLSPLRPLGAGAIERSLTPEEVFEIDGILDRVGQQARDAGLACNEDVVRERFRIGREVWTTSPCYVGWLDVRIRTSGDVYACAPCRQPLGSIRQSSLAEIWNGEPYRLFRRKTRTRNGLAGMAQDCNCGYCCHVLNNARLDRILRWVPRRG
jgi:MoaA/NifB/PqqE/SkfB family radical SAM enzyme